MSKPSTGSRLNDWAANNVGGIVGVLVALVGLLLAEQTTSVVSSTITVIVGGDRQPADESIPAGPSSNVSAEDSGRDGSEVAQAFELPITDGLVSWWNADVGVDVDVRGDVRQWNDQTGGNDLVPPTGKPTLLVDAANGRSAIRFFDGDGEDSADGSGPKLTAATPVGLPSGNAPRTIVTVAQLPPEFNQFDGAAKAGVWWGDSATADRWDGIGFAIAGSCGGDMTISWLSAGGFTCGRYAEWGYLDGTSEGEGYAVAIATYGSGTLRIYVDGVEEKVVPSVVLQTSPQDLTIGGVNEVGHSGRITQSGDFDIGMAAIYDRALEPTEVETLSAYLLQEYLG